MHSFEPPPAFIGWPDELQALCLRAEDAVESSHRLREQTDDILRWSDAMRRATAASIEGMIRCVRAVVR